MREEAVGDRGVRTPLRNSASRIARLPASGSTRTPSSAPPARCMRIQRAMSDAVAEAPPTAAMWPVNSCAPATKAPPCRV